MNPSRLLRPSRGLASKVLLLFRLREAFRKSPLECPHVTTGETTCMPHTSMCSSLGELVNGLNRLGLAQEPWAWTPSTDITIAVLDEVDDDARTLLHDFCRGGMSISGKLVKPFNADSSWIAGDRTMAPTHVIIGSSTSKLDWSYAVLLGSVVSARFVTAAWLTASIEGGELADETKYEQRPPSTPRQSRDVRREVPRRVRHRFHSAS